MARDSEDQRADAVPEGLADLAPSTPLTVAEAARQAGVPRGRIEALMDAGELLFEVARRRGKEVRLIRAFDLQEAFGARRDEPARDEGPGERPSEPEREPPAPREFAAAPSVAPETAMSGSLTPLLQELRARLEEAEQERRASTAGLVMAQRRLIALEEALKPRPLHRRPAVWSGMLACALFVLAWYDLSTRVADSNDEAQSLRIGWTDVANGMQVTVGEIDRRVGELSTTVEDGLGARLASLQEASAEALEEARASRRVAQEQASAEADARRAELGRAERERAQLEERLEDLAREAAAARAALELERDAATRERARFIERLDRADGELERARTGLESERRLAADDRAAFEERLAEEAEARRRREADFRALLTQLEARLELSTEELRGLLRQPAEGAAEPGRDGSQGGTAEPESVPPGTPPPAAGPDSSEPTEDVWSSWLRRVFPGRDA